MSSGWERKNTDESARFTWQRLDVEGHPIRTKVRVSHGNASMWRVIFQQIYLIKGCIQWLARLYDLFKMTS
jgi:hypothetical protein